MLSSAPGAADSRDGSILEMHGVYQENPVIAGGALAKQEVRYRPSATSSLPARSSYISSSSSSSPTTTTTSPSSSSARYGKTLQQQQQAESMRQLLEEQKEKIGDELDDFTLPELCAILVKYSKIFTLIDRRFENRWTLATKMDWAVNYVLRPSFFDDALSTRIANTMLVSALLVTITAGTFLAGPAVDENIDYPDLDGIRAAWTVLCFISTMCFIVSIFLGVYYVEETSRAYTDSDSIYLKFKYYDQKNLSQTFMIAGTIFLIIMLVLTAFFIYGPWMSSVCVFFAILAVVFCVAYMLLTGILVEPGVLQAGHVKSFIDSGLVDPLNGHVKEEVLAYIKANVTLPHEDKK